MKQIKLETPKSGSQLVLDTLKDLGVDTIFGYPGGAVLPLYDAIYDYDGIQHDYTRKQGLIYQKVMLPPMAPSKWIDREQLYTAS